MSGRPLVGRTRHVYYTEGQRAGAVDVFIAGTLVFFMPIYADPSCIKVVDEILREIQELDGLHRPACGVQSWRSPPVC